MPLERMKGERDVHYHLITKDYRQSKLAVEDKCWFAGIVITALNNNSAVSVTFDVYDSAVAAPSSKRLVPRGIKKVWEAGEDNFFAMSYDPPVRAADGIYVELTSVTGRVHYQIIYDQ